MDFSKEVMTQVERLAAATGCTVNEICVNLKDVAEREMFETSAEVHAVLMDLGVGDVHADSAAAKPKAKPVTMGDLTTKARKQLPKGSFADPANRKFPIHDKPHADNAAARLEQQKGKLPPAKYRQIKANIKGAQKRFGEKPQARQQRRRMALMIDHPQHGRIEVYRMSDKQLDGSLFLLGGYQVSDPADLMKGAWNQLGKQGRFFKDGSFFEMNEQTFRDIISNFKNTQNQRVPVDFEHASEMKADGSIAALGAPAHGWITDMKMKGSELWGKIEWDGLAEEYIKGGQYKYLSPAVRFNRKATQGPNVGQPIGAILSSAGLVNIPFLDGMQSVQCKDNADAAKSVNDFNAKHFASEAKSTDVRAMKSTPNRAFSTSEYMPKLKACLKLGELSTTEECKDQFNRLRTHYANAGGDVMAQPQGVDLCSHMMALRDFTQARPQDSWDDILDVVQDMIDDAIQEHEAQMGDGGDTAAGGAEMADTDGDVGNVGGARMADDDGDVGAVGGRRLADDDGDVGAVGGRRLADDDGDVGAVGGRRLKDQPEAVASRRSTNNNEATASNKEGNMDQKQIDEMKVQLKDTEGKLAESSVRLKDAGDASNKLTLQLQAAIAERDELKTKFAALEESVKTMKDESAKREAAEQAAIVDTVVLAYGKTKGVSDASKPALLKLLKADQGSFFELYPKVDASKVHLMKSATSQDGNHRTMKDGEVNAGGAAQGGAGAGAGASAGEDLKIPDQNALIAAFMKDNPKATVEEAVSHAYTEQQRVIATLAGRRARTN